MSETMSRARVRPSAFSCCTVSTGRGETFSRTMRSASSGVTSCFIVGSSHCCSVSHWIHIFIHESVLRHVRLRLKRRFNKSATHMSRTLGTLPYMANVELLCEPQDGMAEHTGEAE